MAGTSDLTDPRYIYGKDIPVLPVVKLARAREHQANLYTQIASWQAGRPVIARLSRDLSDSALVVGLLHVSQPPPLLQWSVVFGDAIHNCRSALDAAVWAFANMGDASPPKPKQVGFPIFSDRNDWAKYSSAVLATVPASVLARLELLQPFNVKDENQVAGLQLLQEFSNADKHRALLLPRPVALEIQVSAQLRYENESDAADFEQGGVQVDPDFSPGLVEGARVFEIRTHAPLLGASGELEVIIEPHVELSQGVVVHMKVALEAALRSADDALRVIAGGVVAADDPRADRNWSPFIMNRLLGPALDEWDAELGGGGRPEAQPDDRRSESG